MSGRLAHAGHWSTSLIYLAPFVAVFLWLGWEKLRGAPSWDEEQEPSSEQADRKA